VTDQTTPGCDCGRPSWKTLTDRAFELWRLREQVHEDQVDLVAARLGRLQVLLGGERRSPGHDRALAREKLQTGDEA